MRTPSRCEEAYWCTQDMIIHRETEATQYEESSTSSKLKQFPRFNPIYPNSIQVHPLKMTVLFSCAILLHKTSLTFWCVREY